MAIDSGWKRRDYLRTCDICGARWKFSKLRPIGEMKFACPDDYKGLTATQISRHNARARPLIVRPVKFPKPVASLDIYQLEEAQIFNYVALNAPWLTQADRDNNAAKSTQAAARAGVYMGDILVENRRPAVWLNTAARTLATCVTYLLTQQYGSPTGTAATDTTGVLHGGVLDGGILSSVTTAIAGVAFLRSYATTGNGDHLQAAKRCAIFLRHQQCAWQSSSGDQTQYGGGVYQLKAVAEGALTAGSISNRYNVADQGAAIWFFTELANVIGDATVYGEASSTYFTGDTRATLAVMVQNCSDFLSIGALTTAGLVTGLSPATPALYYVASTSGSPGFSIWYASGVLLTSVLSDHWALALFGLNFAGLLTTHVNAIYDYLLAMSPNAANSATGLSDAQLLASAKGTYEPAIAPAVSIEATTETTGTYYSWSAAAWLAPIQSGRDPAAFKVTKDTLSRPRRVGTFSQEVRYMGPLSRSGLSFQVAGLAASVATP